ncbi:hypothetical protein RC62_1104 [Flavobacterium aquidurense]|uniref:Uncharacterized protein n=1 Tax=Flavobacterium aquidurense TaxID=362413 RepID=A0A0Q0XTC2_9FLAO|nr:hypothetical protein RC62_1104 [Flavobacterium aquidurense]
MTLLLIALYGFYLICFPTDSLFSFISKEFTLSHFASVVPLSVFTGFELFRYFECF